MYLMSHIPNFTLVMVIVQTEESVLPMEVFSLGVILIINFVLNQSNHIGKRSEMPGSMMVTI